MQIQSLDYPFSLTLEKLSMFTRRYNVEVRFRDCPSRTSEMAWFVEERILDGKYDASAHSAFSAKAVLCKVLPRWYVRLLFEEFQGQRFESVEAAKAKTTEVLDELTTRVRPAPPFWAVENSDGAA